MNEMENLSKLTGKKAMKGLNVLVTHIKPARNNEGRIKKQLSQLNKLRLHLIFPTTGTNGEIIRQG